MLTLIRAAFGISIICQTGGGLYATAKRLPTHDSERVYGGRFCPISGGHRHFNDVKPFFICDP